MNTKQITKVGKIIKPPMSIIERDLTLPSVFLAGAIDMGNAVNWQEESSSVLSTNGFNVFNPRRDDWDSSWEQKIENPQFYQQVNWELNALEIADFILLYFPKDSKAPISFLEMGLFMKSGKMGIIYEEGFYRAGNIQITCDRYNVPLFKTLDEFYSHVFRM